jgi:hypothetical protein
MDIYSRLCCSKGESRMIVTCEHCKVNKGEEEDMTYKFVPILLCDDCYTGIRYWIADELDIHVQGVDI